MFRTLLTTLLFFSFLDSNGQKLSGQWTGGFNSVSDPSGGKTDYVLELEVKDKSVGGYSYTYFNLGNKRCYTICRLSGTYDKGSKSIIVKEVEKVKGNTPPDFKDCFQSHALTYLKTEGREVLVGKWGPATEKDMCGTGKTELERKQLVKVIPQKDQSVANAGRGKPSSGATTPKPSSPAAKVPNPKVETLPPVAKVNPQPQRPDISNPRSSTEPLSSTLPPPAGLNKPQPGREKESVAVIEKPRPQQPTSNERYEKRSKQLIRTIDVAARSFRVDLYDNGQIDGDTVSVYLNGRLMVSRQRLSTTPITLTIDLDDEEQQELIMYAENLGTIPPNTALMVVTIGDKRYEVNITSSEQTNGAVRFVRKSTTNQ